MLNLDLNQILKDILYLNRLSSHLRQNGLTLETATKEDFYNFIRAENCNKIDYYTGKPVTSISYDAELQKIDELVSKYRKLKVIITSLLDNEVL